MILTSADLSGSTITVTDITGRELIKTASRSIDVASLHEGTYLLSIVTIDNNKIVRRFIKQ